MSETKFTKGEWIVYTSKDDWGRIGCDEIVIGMDSYNKDWTNHYCCHKLTLDSSEDESLSNAHLIASAPDTYKALADITEMYTSMINSGDCGNWNPEEDEEVIAARKALKSARGES